MQWPWASALKNEARIIVLAMVTVTLFTLAAVHNNDVFWGDSSMLSALRVDNETGREFFSWFDISPLAIGICVLATSVVLAIFRKRLEAAAALLILPALFFTVALPKFFVDRPRPEGALEGMTNSFPSGSGTVSVLFLGFIIYLVGGFVTHQKLRIGIQLSLGCVVVLLGVFRLLASEHWPSDIVGGYMAGGMALYVIVRLLRILRQRASR